MGMSIVLKVATLEWALDCVWVPPTSPPPTPSLLLCICSPSILILLSGSGDRFDTRQLYYLIEDYCKRERVQLLRSCIFKKRTAPDRVKPPHQLLWVQLDCHRPLHWHQPSLLIIWLRLLYIYLTSTSCLQLSIMLHGSLFQTAHWSLLSIPALSKMSTELCEPSTPQPWAMTFPTPSTTDEPTARILCCIFC